MNINSEDTHPELTDPLDHQDDNFCYLVHAVQWWEYKEWEYVDLLKNPDLISSRSALSTSAINQLKNYTSDYFFILRVPNGNFIEAGNSDLLSPTVSHIWTNPWTLDTKLADLIAKNGLLKYNEVVIAWEHEGNKIEIVWVGIKRREKNNFCIDPTWERMKKIALELWVPIIEFEIYNEMKEETLVNERLSHLFPSFDNSSLLSENNIEWVKWWDNYLTVEDSQFVFTFTFNNEQNIVVEKKEIGTDKSYEFKLLDYLTIRKYIVKSIWDDKEKRDMLVHIDNYFQSSEYLKDRS